jgi:hypothetical protein
MKLTIVNKLGRSAISPQEWGGVQFSQIPTVVSAIYPLFIIYFQLNNKLFCLYFMQISILIFNSHLYL